MSSMPLSSRESLESSVSAVFCTKLTRIAFETSTMTFAQWPRRP